jgi:hypothetical protein
LEDEAVLRLCTPRDVARMIDVLKDSGTNRDDRVRIFGLWALDHLSSKLRGAESTESRYVRQDDGVPAMLEFSDRWDVWLAAEINHTAERLIRNNVALFDLHSPYQVFFTTRSVGERYREDYFVIPVLPTLLDLIAKYQPSWVFRPAVGQLLHMLYVAANERDSLGNMSVLPFQAGNYNGTVNALYYCEATTRIAAALRDGHKRAWWYRSLGMVRDQKKVLVLGGLTAGVIIGIGALLVYGEPSSTAVGFLLGIAASFVANLITPSLLVWLRRIK